MIAKKSEDIAMYAKAIDPDFDKKDIHKFRVSVKALRAFLALQRVVDGRGKVQLPKKFKQLYDIAGSVREAQLGLEFFAEKNIPRKLYVDHLTGVIKKEKAKWDNHDIAKI